MRLRKNGVSWLGICSIAVLLTLMTGAAVAEERQALSRGQTIYVPVYSHIWYGNVDSRLKASKLLLSSMLSIRNVDPDHSIVVNMVPTRSILLSSMRDRKYRRDSNASARLPARANRANRIDPPLAGEL